MDRLPGSPPSPRPGWSGSRPGPVTVPTDNLAVRLPAGTDAERIEWLDLGYAASTPACTRRSAGCATRGWCRPGSASRSSTPHRSPVGALVHPDGRDRFVRSYGRALTADLDRLLSQILHGDVAVQWDAAVETVLVDQQPDTLPSWPGGSPRCSTTCPTTSRPACTSATATPGTCT